MPNPIACIASPPSITYRKVLRNRSTRAKAAVRRKKVRRLVPFLLPLVTLAQVPSISIIDVYGARKITPAQIRKFLGINEGSSLPGSKADLEERLEQMPGVVTAHIEAACCDESKAILYVG